jgi:hypothetical protein
MKAAVSCCAVLCLLTLDASLCRGGELEQVEIQNVRIAGTLYGGKSVELYVETQTVAAAEVLRRMNQFSLYGAEPVRTHPQQAVLKRMQIRVGGRRFSAPESALQDLFDPAFVYTLHLTSDGGKIFISWVGGSGEREYRCKFIVTGDGLIRREITQRDNQNRDVTTATDI